MIFAFDSILAALTASFAAFAAAILVMRLGCSSGVDAFSWLITLVVAVNDNKVEVVLLEFLLRLGARLGKSWLAVLHFTLPAPKAARG
jgi:predicted tellurium resistance membrane protein TerC